MQVRRVDTAEENCDARKERTDFRKIVPSERNREVWGEGGGGQGR